MTKIEKIEQEIQRLTPAELAAFRDWFHGYDADAWDRQIERDIAAGKLDKLAEEARANHAAGKSKPLEDALAEGTAGVTAAAGGARHSGRPELWYLNLGLKRMNE